VEAMRATSIMMLDGKQDHLIFDSLSCTVHYVQDRREELIVKLLLVENICNYKAIFTSLVDEGETS